METYEYSWSEQFYYFSLFRALHGPDATPNKEDESPIDEETYYTQSDLATWIREQNNCRKMFLDGKASDITPNQIKVLDQASFPWIRDSSERWDGHFRELMAFKEEHGHCNVPRKAGKLGIWVKNQRAAYHKLYDLATGGGGNGGNNEGDEHDNNNNNNHQNNVKKTTAVITSDQIKLLADLGFQWKIRASHTVTWNNHFENLKAFQQKHGHCRVNSKEDNVLGRWICEMRSRYKQRLNGEVKTRINDDQIALLDGIGFEWKKWTGDPEEKKRRALETRKRENENKRRKRAEAKKIRMEARAIAVRKEEAERTARKRREKEERAEAKKARRKEAIKKRKEADFMMNDIERKLSGKRLKRNSGVDLGISLDEIENDIESKLVAENIPVVSDVVRMAASNAWT